MKSIKKVEKIGNKTKIIFNNGKKIIVESSKLSIDNQIYRSSKLESIIKRRIKAKKST